MRPPAKPRPGRPGLLLGLLALVLAGCAEGPAWPDIAAAQYAPDTARARARPAFGLQLEGYAPPLPAPPPPRFMLVIP